MKIIVASHAGVKIELLVRGICCLIPGVEGFTDNLTVHSIVGRFLEHSRIYIFGTDGEEQKIYISSADYMTRNTIHRVEVAAPVLDSKLKKRVREIFRILMSDNAKTRIMQNDGLYTHAKPVEGEAPLNAQEYFYEEAYKKAETKKQRQDRQQKIQRKRLQNQPILLPRLPRKYRR